MDIKNLKEEIITTAVKSIANKWFIDNKNDELFTIEVESKILSKTIIVNIELYGGMCGNAVYLKSNDERLRLFGLTEEEVSLIEAAMFISDN